MGILSLLAAPHAGRSGDRCEVTILHPHGSVNGAQPAPSGRGAWGDRGLACALTRPQMLLYCLSPGGQQ